MNLLYVGCAGCRSIVPLYCAGQFMAHTPIPIVKTRSGFGCQLCGLMPPVYTCTICWLTQMTYVPQTSALPPQALFGARQIAPVVEATPGANPQELKVKFSDIAKKALGGFTEEFAKGMGQNAAACFKSWVTT